MRDMTIGQYYPSNSVVHRADPRFKLLILILFIVTVFFCESFFSFGFMTFFVIVTILLARVPILKVLKGLKMIIIIVLITTLLMTVFYTDPNSKPLAEWGIFHIYLNGIYAAIKLAWRLLLLVLMPTVLTLTSTPTVRRTGKPAVAAQKNQVSRARACAHNEHSVAAYPHAHRGNGQNNERAKSARRGVRVAQPV